MPAAKLSEISVRPSQILRLCLYVAGGAPNSELARGRLVEMLASLPPGSSDLEIVDILENPARAESDRVWLTPTLVKISPSPQQRVVGSLTDSALLRRILGGYK
jgi:circadian clock protein KaiB